MTFLESVNSVLSRLRETAVTSVSATTYSTQIGQFINDAKRQVEDAWNWDALYTVKTVTTSSGVSNYTGTGWGLNQKQAVVNDTTNKGKIPIRSRYSC